MKTIISVLAGLTVWCAVLSGCLVAEYQAVSSLQFIVAAQSRDLSLLRAQMLVGSLRAKNVQNHDRARERELEHLVFKLIDALTQQEPDKPSAYDKSMDTGQ